MCLKYVNMRSEIISLCDEKGVSVECSKFLINKLSNYIRKTNFDVHEIILSLDYYDNKGYQYVIYHKVESSESTLYVVFVVD